MSAEEIALVEHIVDVAAAVVVFVVVLLAARWFVRWVAGDDQ